MRTLAASEPRAQNLEFIEDALVVHLEDGRSLSVPMEWFPRLRDATTSQRSNWRLIGHGIGIHWQGLDEDLSVRGLLTPKKSLLFFTQIEREKPWPDGLAVCPLPGDFYIPDISPDLEVDAEDLHQISQVHRNLHLLAAHNLENSVSVE